MGAPVLEAVELTVSVARHDHRCLADEGGAVVSRAGYLGFQAQVAPVRAVEQLGLLGRVDILSLEHPIRHTGEVVGPIRLGLADRVDNAAFHNFSSVWTTSRDIRELARRDLTSPVAVRITNI